MFSLEADEKQVELPCTKCVRPSVIQFMMYDNGKDVPTDVELLFGNVKCDEAVDYCIDQNCKCTGHQMDLYTVMYLIYKDLIKNLNKGVVNAYDLALDSFCRFDEERPLIGLNWKAACYYDNYFLGVVHPTDWWSHFKFAKEGTVFGATEFEAERKIPAYGIRLGPHGLFTVQMRPDIPCAIELFDARNKATQNLNKQMKEIPEVSRIISSVNQTSEEIPEDQNERLFEQYRVQADEEIRKAMRRYAACQCKGEHDLIGIHQHEPNEWPDPDLFDSSDLELAVITSPF
jgi:hypothetical protein